MKEVDENLTSLTTTFLSRSYLLRISVLYSFQSCESSDLPDWTSSHSQCPWYYPMSVCSGHPVISNIYTNIGLGYQRTCVISSALYHTIHNPKILSYFPYIPRNPPPVHCSLFDDFSHGTVTIHTAV
jgi:hypothetical protein